MQWLLPPLGRMVDELHGGTVNAGRGPRRVHGGETKSTLLPTDSALICKTAGTALPLSEQLKRRTEATEKSLGKGILLMGHCRALQCLNADDLPVDAGK